MHGPVYNLSKAKMSSDFCKSLQPFQVTLHICVTLYYEYGKHGFWYKVVVSANVGKGLACHPRTQEEPSGVICAVGKGLSLSFYM